LYVLAKAVQDGDRSNITEPDIGPVMTGDDWARLTGDKI